MAEILAAVEVFGMDNLMLAHATSSYPCKLNELNLKMITTLRTIFPEMPIGYSGHETGLAPSFYAAVALGAAFVERHITLDRAMWGTDQAASVEVSGFAKLVDNIRDIQLSLGDGIKKLYDSELSSRKKFKKSKLGDANFGNHFRLFFKSGFNNNSNRYYHCRFCHCSDSARKIPLHQGSEAFEGRLF